MQRNITYKEFINYTLWSMAYLLYLSLSTIYLFLPPMLSILFLIFLNSLEKQNSVKLTFIILILLVFEAQKGFLAFSIIIYFLILYRFFIPKINKNISSKKIRILIYILLSYIGYIIFYTLLAQIFILPSLSVDYYIIYYIVIEYFIASVFL